MARSTVPAPEKTSDKSPDKSQETDLKKINILPIRSKFEVYKTKFATEEKPTFDSILALYQGHAWEDKGVKSPLSVPKALTESEMMKTSVNLAFAILETARSTLVPTEVETTCTYPGSSNTDPLALAQQQILDRDIRNTDLVGEIARFVEDGVLFGRWILKVGWDAKEGTPYAKLADINAMIFDLEAKRQADIRFFGECTPLSKSEFMKRIANGVYPAWAEDVVAAAYPEWLRRNNEEPTAQEQQCNVWYNVYEYYDIENSLVYHFADGHDHPLLVDKLVYNPYILDFFNDNKQDCRGLSEIALIANNNIELNVLSTMLLEIVRTTIPKVLADKGHVDSDEIADAQDSPIGTVSLMTVPQGKTLRDLFYEYPQPQAPNMLMPLVERLWQNIMFVSALADAQRGQVTGAKTATELAMLDAQLKNRLKSRQMKIDKTITKVLEMYWYLRTIFGKEIDVWVDGKNTKVKPEDFPKMTTIKLQPYAPTATNQAIIREMWMGQYPLLKQDPNIDQALLTQEYLKVMNMPSGLFKPAPPPPAAAPEPVPPGGPAMLPAAPVMPDTGATEGPVVPSPESVNPDAPFKN